MSAPGSDFGAKGPLTDQERLLVGGEVGPAGCAEAAAQRRWHEA